MIIDMLDGGRLFDKLLVARHSPENGCFVESGAILIALPRKISGKGKDSISHYFVDSSDKKNKSRYGWVTLVEPFRLEDFIVRYGDCTDDESKVSHLLKMLEGISTLAVDTPVAATYFGRGVEQKTLEFKVHRVFFR